MINVTPTADGFGTIEIRNVSYQTATNIPGRSELENYIHRQLELALPRPVVVRATIESAIEPDFGTQQNSASLPVSPHQSFLRVAVLEAGSLPLHVIQEVGAD